MTHRSPTRKRSHGRPRRRFTATVVVVIAAAIATVVTFAQAPEKDVRRAALAAELAAHRTLDARVGLLVPAAVPQADQQDEVNALRALMPDLRVEFDPSTGATKSLWNMAGFLTPADARSPRAIAEDFMASRTSLLGLSASDVVDVELTDDVYSSLSGLTHLYYRQRVNGVPVYNGQLQFNITKDGRLLSVHNAFLPNLTASLASLRPSLDAAAAVRHAGDHLGVAGVDAAVALAGRGVQQTTELSAPDLSSEPIKAELMVLPLSKGQARLVWNFQVWTLDDQHAFDMNVDAETGQVWTRFDWVAADQYRVFPVPVESPNHATPVNTRSLVTNPANATASPFGWHDTNGVAGAEFTVTEGNNVSAYTDTDNNNVPDAGSSPDCGATLNCDFALDLTQAPSAYRPAAVANLFYWNNIVHDVQHRYGFDEGSGNFQVNNYGRGGAGNDSVQAEAQDGGGTNNANFATPPDGSRPRMQMYLWNTSTPNRDGDFDAGVVVHEYGHGISNRLIGGPNSVSCMQNQQQPGEGISDWLSLVYTALPGQTGATARGIGTYVLNQPTTGAGIRTQRYSTDPAVNNFTYASISSMTIPHGVGSVWAQGMWEVYWRLVDDYGFSPDLYNATGGAGNQRAMQYHTEGMKIAPCSSGFTQLRDGIIQAAQTMNGGADVCRLWGAFAGFGLGVDAVNPNSNSTAGIVNGFNTPTACGGTGSPDMSINDVSVTEGNSGTTTATFTVSLATPSASPTSVNFTTADGTATASSNIANTTALTIPATGSGTATGAPASLYPSTIAVAGIGTIQSMAVRLDGLSHTWPDDLDVLLVGPGGQRVMLMSDVGGGTDLVSATLTIRDGATAFPDGGPIVSGTYAPTDVTPGETMPVPAPAGPYGTALSVFNGTDANGTWSLYITDDETVDTGAMTGWTLQFVTASADYVATSGVVSFTAGQTSRTITVTINGDTTSEPNETFFVNLTNPVNATIVDAQGIGTILNDEASVPTTTNDAFGTTYPSALNVVAPGVLGNDNSNGGGAMTAQLITNVSNGTLTLGATGSVSYTPNFGFAGTDSFTYRAVNGVGNGNVATVTITVAPPTNVQPPYNLRVDSVVGNLVTLRWNALPIGPQASTFVLEGGVTPGQVLASIPTGSPSPIFTFVAPTGSWSIRMHGQAGSDKSAASNEVALHVNVPVTPSAPGNLLGLVSGSTLNLTWKNTFEGGPPSGVVLDVTGSATVSLPMGPAETFTFTPVPGGSYTFRVREVNAGGSSAASAPVSLTFPGGCTAAPDVPANFLGYRVGSTAYVIWDPPASGAAPTSYVLDVTGSFVGTFATPGRMLSGAVTPGNYNVRVQAVNACGASAFTPTQVISVP